jgi:hypothetical protein
MPRVRLTFRQRDVAAALRAVQQAGLQVKEVTITSEGEIRIITGSPSDADAPTKNPLDKYYANPPPIHKRVP